MVENPRAGIRYSSQQANSNTKEIIIYGNYAETLATHLQKILPENRITTTATRPKNPQCYTIEASEPFLLREAKRLNLSP